MKKLLLILALTTTTAYAGEPTTSDKKTVGDFIKAGGFHELCNRLQWQWGWLDTGRACFSSRYMARNGYAYNADTDSFVKR